MEKVGIRVDVNEKVATGHFMRCATISEQLQRMGAAAVFISADTQIVPFAEERNLEYHILHSDWKHLEDETKQLISYLQGTQIHTLLVDTYLVTEQYLEALREAGIRVLYMDDLNAMKYPADVLVNYSPSYLDGNYSEEYKDSGTELLLGVSYVPLRAQFMQHTQEYLGRRGLHRIFLTTGGSDPMGIAELLIRRILSDPLLADVEIHLLAGRFYHAPSSLFGADSPFAGRLVLHQNVSDVAGIMAPCDAGVTPAGTTLYELSACGVPSVSFVFADNQETDAIFFDREGLIPYAGDFREDPDACCENVIRQLYRIAELSPEDYRRACEKLQGTIDGKGAQRIAEALLRL